MSGVLLDRIRAGEPVADLRNGIRLRLSGADVLRYLNGQVTNDIRRLGSGAAMPAGIANHRGKLEALVMVSVDPEGRWLVSGDAGLRGSLQTRLEKYVIADDVVVEDVSDSLMLLHGFGEPPEGAPGWTAAAERFGVPGFDWWLTPEDAARVLEGRAVLTAEEIASLRAMFRVPAWQEELSGGDVLPQEARLEETAVDFFKGCYVGQEVISRIRSVGHVNRQLESFLRISGPPLQAGWTLYDPENAATGGRAAGSLTTVAVHPVTGAEIALGFRRRGAPDRLTAGPDPDNAAAVIEVRKTLDE